MRATLPASITVHGAILAALVLIAAPPPPPPAIVRVSLAMPQPKPEPAPAPAPVMQPVPPPPVAQAKPPPPRPLPPKPQVKPLARQAPVQAPPPAPMPQTPSPVAAESAPVTASAAPVAEAAAPAIAAPLSGEPGKAKADYMAQLRAWLEKHKDYPRAARQRGLEGVAHLRFVMDRDGRVLSHQITRGSGYDLLDEEVEEMIRRAQPLPPIPPEMHQAQLEVVVPIGFRLR